MGELPTRPPAGPPRGFEADLLPRAHGLAGGAVYDGLVAAAAVEHGLVLASRDCRAAETHQRLGVRLQLLT